MGEEKLQVLHDQHPGGSVLTVSGEVDLYSASTLSAAALAVLEELAGRAEPERTGGALRLVIDLAAVPFMDSSGLGVLVGVLRRARSTGVVLVLAAPQDPLVRLLQLTGLAAVVPVREDARAALAPRDEEQVRPG